MSVRFFLSLVLTLSGVVSIGCVGPFGWRSDPPWLTAWMEEGELVSEIAKNIPLGTAREDVLKNLERRGVRPFAEIVNDGDSGQDMFVVTDDSNDPQFEFTENSYGHHFAYLDENYFVERDGRIAILVGTYRATPPWGTMVSWAPSIEGEVIVTLEDNLVHAVTFRPLDSESSRNRVASFKIESLR